MAASVRLTPGLHCMIDNTMTLPRALGRGSSSFASRMLTHLALFLFLWTCFGPTASAQAGDEKEIQDALEKLSAPHEKAGFDFRADIWQRELEPEMGKAVRIQMFKGNEYRVCVAVPPGSKVHVAAHVLDFEGKPAESKIESTENSWGAVLHVKPNKTGIYLVVIRHDGGEKRKTLCGMITGYK